MTRKTILDPGIKARQEIADFLFELACKRFGDPTQIIEEAALTHRVSLYLCGQIFWELVANHTIGEDVARGW